MNINDLGEIQTHYDEEKKGTVVRFPAYPSLNTFIEQGDRLGVNNPLWSVERKLAEDERQNLCFMRVTERG